MKRMKSENGSKYIQGEIVEVVFTEVCHLINIKVMLELENHFEMIIYSGKGHEWMPNLLSEKLMETKLFT